MTQLSKRERVDLALKGEVVDRVPVSAWRHFIDEERQPESLARVSLRHFFDYDWDWLKVNPRATYYAEAWGNRYDYEHYDSVLPRLIDGPINSPADLVKITELSGTGGVFAEHLSLVQRIKSGIGGAHFLQTVFSPLSVLAFLVARPKTNSIEAATQAQYDGLRQYLKENPQGVHAALKAISSTLAKYSAAVVEAGASGLFFAIVKLAREAVFTEAEYEEFGKPYDLEVLHAVRGAPFNLLHTCGPRVYFDTAIKYPVHALNWAAVGQHNPTVGEASHLTLQALVGGVDELGPLQYGSPEDVIKEARAAIAATGGRRFLLTPGCATNVNVPGPNLHALRLAADLVPAVA